MSISSTIQEVVIMDSEKEKWLWDELQAKNIKLEALKLENAQLINERNVFIKEAEKLRNDNKELKESIQGLKIYIQSLKEQLNHFDD